MKYLFIINPKSGARHPIPQIMDQIKYIFDKSPEHEYEIVYSRYAGHARVLAEQAIKNKFDMVVAAGGDGTVNEVCSALVNSKTSFGLIPMGSGNGFARSMGIPLKYKNAIDRLIDGLIQKIDVGRINDHYFFGIAGFSFDALIGAKFGTFNHRGPLPYFYIGLREFFNYEYEEFELTFDDKRLVVNPLILTIANTSQYGNGAAIAPQADCSDGLFDICIINKMNLKDGVFKLHYLFNNKIQQLSGYQSYRTNKLKIIRKNGSGFYHLDGETFNDSSSFEIEVLPGALSVCS